MAHDPAKVEGLRQYADFTSTKVSPTIMGMTGRPTDSAARKAGAFLLLTAAATIVSVVARLSADADQSTLAESLSAISESRGLYGVGGAARLVSGITLIAGAWFLLRVWTIRERLGTPLVPALFGASGISTALSGVCAVVLAVSVSEAPGPAITGSTETIVYIRWLTGKIGFAAAGLGLVVAAWPQWKAGGTLRFISPASAVIGVAMQFIWVNAATVIHPLSGAAFFVWLAVVGAMLLAGRVERGFAATLDSPSTD